MRPISPFLLLLVASLALATIQNGEPTPAEPKPSESGPEEAKMRLVVSPAVATIQRAVGGELQLMCRAENTGSDEVGLMWTKHNGIDKTGNVKVKKLDNRNIALLISNATVADSGFYQCSGTGAGQYVETTVDVFFFNELRFLDMNSHIDSILATATLNISCRVHQSEGELIKTTWSRYDIPLPVLPEKFTFFNGGSILQIKEYDPSSDSGEFVCRVENLTTGNKIKQTFAVGGRLNSRRASCVNHCRNFCSNLFPSEL